MAKTTFFAIACAVVCVHAAAWGQGPGMAFQGPYNAPVGPWAGGPGVIPVAYQSPAMAAPMQAGPMQAGPMQPGPMMAGPMQAGPEAMYGGAGCGGMCAGDPSCMGCDRTPDWQAFGDILYLRPRNANVAYGVLFNASATAPNGQPENAPHSGDPTIEIAAPGIASIDFHPGFRVGMGKALDDCNAVVATFTHYEGEDQSSYASPGLPGEIRSLVSHPGVWGINAPIDPATGTAAGNFTDDWASASSDYQMIYSLADVDFRWTFSNQDCTRLSLIAGARYVSLDQRLDVLGTTPVNTLGIQPDIQDVHSQINFEGGGLRFGFEGERRTPRGLIVYGRAAASLVAGTFRCNYTQTSGLLGPEVVTGDTADRVVPMLDVELGTGLSLWNDKLHLTAGYSFSGWFNIVRTDQFIAGVQGNSFSGMNSTLTFDGFVGRVELQF